MKQKFWARDWFAAVAFTLVFAILAFGVFADGFESVERYAYDLGVRTRERTPSDRIAIVAIDDDSIRNLGRWPWPRARQAELIDKLREGGAKVIGSTALYLEAEQNGDAAFASSLRQQLDTSPLTQQIPVEIETFRLMLKDAAQTTPQLGELSAAFDASALVHDYGRLMTRLVGSLDAAAGKSGDGLLAQALEAQGHTLLPMLFTIGRPQGRPDAPLPDYVRRNVLTRIEDRVGARADGALPLPTREALVPIAALGGAAAALGHLNTTPDVDGAVRFEPLVLQYFREDEFYPSLSLMIAASALNLTPQDIEVRLGEGIAMAGLEIGTSPALRMYTHFYRGDAEHPAFPVDSAYDVLSGKLPVTKYKDKIVLIGTTAVGTGDTFATPVSAATAPVVTLAHNVSSLLQGDFFTRPAWTGWAELALFVALAAYLALVLPLLGATTAAALTLVIAVGLIATQIGVMVSSAIWLKLTVAALFLLAGHGFMTVKKFNITERLKQTSDAEGAESNRMLGLAFQGQGQLDMAFEKFRRVQPVDDKLLDLIYNLALDFERKRQFNKAESAYQYIAGFNKDFRDIQQKLNRAKKLSETIILGGSAASSHPGGALVLDATAQIEKPMLGRYQVEKELGKGAMGIVYMGRDPKIGRQVAIKTMALSQEFEPDELASVKERFFREAETAGKLTHPNIVSIYDAGEDHDLAYIAMEFVRGHDLTRHTKPNALLPAREVLRLVADAADALDYAHGNGIVHRDIKPANMMLIETSGVLKLMDFGIARITDSSKTKTGMVLGTPSYMSPEQLAGKKVDGRSDLFSLGVTLYQLLTGALPFQADSMVNLMLKITNEAHTPAGVLRPDLPPTVVQIIDRILSKKADDRYQRGADLARDLRAAIPTIGTA